MESATDFDKTFCHRLSNLIGNKIWKHLQAVIWKQILLFWKFQSWIFECTTRFDRWLCPLSFGYRRWRYPCGLRKMLILLLTVLLSWPVSSSFSAESSALVHGLEWCHSHL